MWKYAFLGGRNRPDLIVPGIHRKQTLTGYLTLFSSTMRITASKNQNLDKNYERCDVDIIFNLNIAKLLFRYQS